MVSSGVKTGLKDETDSNTDGISSWIISSGPFRF